MCCLHSCTLAVLLPTPASWRSRGISLLASVDYWEAVLLLWSERTELEFEVSGSEDDIPTVAWCVTAFA